MTETETLQAEIQRLRLEIGEWQLIGNLCMTLLAANSEFRQIPRDIEDIREDLEEHYKCIRILRGEE